MDFVAGWLYLSPHLPAVLHVLSVNDGVSEVCDYCAVLHVLSVNGVS